MSEPTPLTRSMTEVAQESTEDSVERGGDEPDEGDLADEDHAQ